MLITESTLSHVRELDGAFGACIHEPVTALWVELGCCDHFCQLFHVGWFDVDDIEALILDVQVPQVYPQVVTANESLPITVHRDAVDVICVGIGVSSSRYCCYNGIMVGKAG